jgi:hypothetical protein|tara:strand:- start:1471 stop:1701 length:231 start_codon:yes stop_codon:yes gene_type:complete
MTARKSKVTIDNVESLRNNLSEIFDALRDGAIAHKEAKEISNLAGKMINSAKVQLDYHSLRKDENFKINFLHSKDK